MKRRSVVAVVLFVSVLLAFEPVWGCNIFAIGKKLFSTDNGFPDDWITSIVPSKDGHLYIGLKDNGVVILKDDQIIASTCKVIRKGIEDSLPEERVKCLALDDSEKDLWVGTVGGLFLHDPITLDMRMEYQGGKAFADNIIQSLAVGPEGVALGTTKGVALSSYNWNFLTDRDGLPSLTVNSVEFNAEGRLGAGLSEGMAVLKDGKFLRAGLEGQWVTSLQKDSPNLKMIDENLRDCIRRTFERLLGILSDEALNPSQAPFAPPDVEPPPSMAVENATWTQEIKDYLEILNGQGTTDGFYAGTNDGVYHAGQLGTPPEKIIEGWTNCLSADPVGNLYAGQRGLKIVPRVALLNLLEEMHVAREMRNEAIKLLLRKKTDATKTMKLDPVTGQIVEEKYASETDSVTVITIASSSRLDPMNATESELEKPPEVSDQEWNRVMEKISKAEITTLVVTKNGEFWVGTGGAGLFRFRPFVVNVEVLGAIIAGMKVEFRDGFFPIKAKQPELDPEVKALAARALGSFHTREPFKYWIGRWSQLEQTDQEMFLKCLVKYLDSMHFQKYLPLFFYDPFMTLPIGMASPTKELEPPKTE